MKIDRQMSPTSPHILIILGKIVQVFFYFCKDDVKLHKICFKNRQNPKIDLPYRPWLIFTLFLFECMKNINKIKFIKSSKSDLIATPTLTLNNDKSQQVTIALYYILQHAHERNHQTNILKMPHQYFPYVKLVSSISTLHHFLY